MNLENAMHLSELASAHLLRLSPDPWLPCNKRLFNYFHPVATHAMHPA